MRMRAIITPLCSVVILAACGAPPGSTPTTATAPEETRLSSSEPTPTPSLKRPSEQPSLVPNATGALTGVLGADSIEGGCGYLQTADGTRYEVIYPDGWALSLSPLQIIDPDGEVVAEGGDEVTVRGSVASDMASICQIGPIFRATKVDH